MNGETTGEFPHLRAHEFVPSVDDEESCTVCPLPKSNTHFHVDLSAVVDPSEPRRAEL